MILLFKAFRISLVSLYVPLFFVDLVLKQKRISAKILFLLICSRSWICVALSSTVENEVRCDICLEIFILSPFLNKGFISEYLKWSGKISDDDLLHMWVRGELICNSLVYILSYLCDFFNLWDLIIFLTSLVHKNLSFCSERGS